MPDVHDIATRSRNMAAIKASNTGPELLLRSALHRSGFRFRLKSRDVPGKPDLVLPKYHSAIFVHGCFWHGHECDRFKEPGGQNAEFWRNKINRNRRRDGQVAELVSKVNWRQLVVWECALIGKRRYPIDAVVKMVSLWLQSAEATGMIEGRALE